MDELDDYLCIEPYLAHFTAAQALGTALRCGLVDALLACDSADSRQLAARLDMDADGLQLLCGLLAGIDAVQADGQSWRLGDGFRHALNYRDLLQARLEFADLLAPDLLQRMQQYVEDFPAFMAGSKVFELFRYDLACEPSPANLAATRAWVRYTTVLTRYEAPLCTRYLDFAPLHRMLDIGGNSGEFVSRLCARYPRLHADVYDLPLVCEVGREHVAGTPQAKRIRFIAGDALSDAMPGGYDLASFKSMLHDWPPEAVQILLDQALSALSPDGTLLIFERAPLAAAQAATRYGLLPMLLFQRNFREPEDYAVMLRERGFGQVRIDRFQLDTPFFVLQARRGDA